MYIYIYIYISDLHERRDLRRPLLLVTSIHRLQACIRQVADLSKNVIREALSPVLPANRDFSGPIVLDFLGPSTHFRGASLMGNCLSLELCIRTMPRALWLS